MFKLSRFSLSGPLGVLSDGVYDIKNLKYAGTPHTSSFFVCRSIEKLR